MDFTGADVTETLTVWKYLTSVQSSSGQSADVRSRLSTATVVHRMPLSLFVYVCTQGIAYLSFCSMVCSSWSTFGQWKS